MSRTVLVTGASGFVGSHLAQALVDGGHRVRAMTRHPQDYSGAGEPVEGDVADRASLVRRLSGADAANYLFHIPSGAQVCGQGLAVAAEPAQVDDAFEAGQAGS